NLMGCWRFDGNLFDSSGNDRNGTPQGDPQFGAGTYGDAVELDGDDYVTIDGYKGVLGTHAFSVTAWIKTSDTSQQQIIHWGNHADGQRFELRIQGNRLRVSHGGGNVQGDTTVTDGQWHHVAVTVIDNSTASSGDVTFYVDGQDDTRASSDPDGWDIVANATLDLTIGWRPTQQDRPFIGSMDDVTLYDKVLTPEEVVAIMNGEIGVFVPALASGPSPAHEEPDARRDAVLSWTPGDYVEGLSPKHRVFFSESLDDVSGGIGGVTQDANTYAAGILDFSKTYYWRVDEANAVSGWDQGDIWQFTVEPFAYSIPAAAIAATASSVHEVDTIPENTVDGSGLDADDLHSMEESEMWLSNEAGPEPAWIQYKFDKIYKLHEMWVWNHNSSFETSVGWGVREAIIEYSSDGSQWTRLGDTHEFVRAPGAAGYAHDTPVDFGGVGAKYVKITINSNWGGILTQYGLSEVRFLYIPVQAREPMPGSGATGVDLDLSLDWRPGRQADRHDVYLSTSKKDVAKGSADVTTVTESRYGPLSLDLGDTYY
ncbi:MAG: LamG domain-containing protein, partial [Dehalococcoidia bacterium]